MTFINRPKKLPVAKPMSGFPLPKGGDTHDD